MQKPDARTNRSHNQLIGPLLDYASDGCVVTGPEEYPPDGASEGATTEQTRRKRFYFHGNGI